MGLQDAIAREKQLRSAMEHIDGFRARHGLPPFDFEVKRIAGGDFEAAPIIGPGRYDPDEETALDCCPWDMSEAAKELAKEIDKDILDSFMADRESAELFNELASDLETVNKLIEEGDRSVYAPDLLRKAADTIADRAAARDSDKGGRSMHKAVATFNAMTGHNLSIEDGWLFMVYLKHARMRGGHFHGDDYVDGVGYEALMAEEAYRSKGQSNAGEHSRLSQSVRPEE